MQDRLCLTAPKLTPTAVRRGSQCWPSLRVRFLAWLRTRMLMLEIGGQPVTVMVEREQLEDLAADGYPADRSVYVITWNDHQIDDTTIIR